MARSMRVVPMVVAALSAACLSNEPRGIGRAAPASTTVKFDFFHRPLPDIPLPNDIATRADPTSATGLRLNASLLAPTSFEATLRRLLAQRESAAVAAE